jgi:hypothetical protein
MNIEILQKLGFEPAGKTESMGIYSGNDHTGNKIMSDTQKMDFMHWM